MNLPDQNHLAIGEVLGLLQADFPDVTISKIRFLESQGLIDPERTPSGYRKFYAADLVQLRWILTQQRDHFLPLKVIRERLEEANELQLPLEIDQSPGLTEAVPEAVAGDDGAATRAAAARDEITSTGGGGPRINVFTATATPRPASRLAAGSVTSSVDERGARAAQRSPSVVTPLGRTVPDEGPVAPARVETLALFGSAGSDGDEALTGSTLTAAVVDGAQDPAAATAVSGRTRRRVAAGGNPFGEPNSVSLTREEISAAVGLTVTEVAELERYGLITSRLLSQGRRYGDDAVLVAKLAARFADFGVQARHLRMFKVAVERELALYEQIVAPLMRHHHDGAAGVDVAAAKRWADLDELGADLRDALFRRSPA